MCNCAESAEQPLSHPMVVSIHPGDVLVVHSNKLATGERIKTQLDSIAPGAHVLVVDDGAALTHILRPAG